MNLILALGLAFASFASAAPLQKRGYVVNTVFKFRLAGKVAHTASTFVLDAHNKSWTALTEPQEGVALLGRVVESDAKSLHMEYIVVDTTKRNSVISTPAIVALLGEEAKFQVNDKTGDQISVSLLARPTEYTGRK